MTAKQLSGSLLIVGVAVILAALSSWGKLSGTLIAVVVLVLVALAIWGYLRDRRRQDAIIRWAARSGWTIQKDAQVPFLNRLPGYERRKISLLLHSTISGRPVAVAEYSWTRANPGSSYADAGDGILDSLVPDLFGDPSLNSHHFVVTAVRLPRPYPPLSVARRRHGLYGLRQKMAGGKAVSLDYPPFDDKFRVTTNQQELARRLLGPTLVAEHVDGRLPTWSVVDHDLISWRPGRLDDPEKIPEEIAPLLRVADLLGH
ncbi:hypothetical protein ACQKHK_12560 [Staphylococcus capitis]|uniref:hypothetical protein n=1 Tax=Staphylococcus capitis TaxID=29388 RepID=UPI003CFDB06D